MKKTTIYEGKTYKEKRRSKTFVPKFYNHNGETVMLVPNWVNQSPENWEVVGKRQDKAPE